MAGNVLKVCIWQEQCHSQSRPSPTLPLPSLKKYELLKVPITELGETSDFSGRSTFYWEIFWSLLHPRHTELHLKALFENNIKGNN